MSFTITGPGGPTPAGAVSGSGTPAPAVAAIGSGRWVAVWQADNTVEARVFEADGAPVDASFLVAADALAGVARVAALASGGFVVTWAADPAAARRPTFSSAATTWTATRSTLRRSPLSSTTPMTARRRAT